MLLLYYALYNPQYHWRKTETAMTWGHLKLFGILVLWLEILWSHRWQQWHSARDGTSWAWLQSNSVPVSVKVTEPKWFCPVVKEETGEISGHMWLFRRIDLIECIYYCAAMNLRNKDIKWYCAEAHEGVFYCHDLPSCSCIKVTVPPSLGDFRAVPSRHVCKYHLI